MLKGKKLSILGDSISTYRGVSDDASATYSLIYNPCYYKEPLPLDKTYWKLVMDHFGLELCVNNSWSGGNLSNRENPDSGVNRANYLSRDDGTIPDIVIVFMGLNDLGRRVSPSVFFEDYKHTLLTIKNKFPHAFICCINLPDREIIMKKPTEEFNRLIADAANAAGENVFIADLFNSRLNNDFYYRNTLDGLHPDEDGMRFIADVVIAAIEQNCNDRIEI